MFKSPSVNDSSGSPKDKKKTKRSFKFFRNLAVLLPSPASSSTASNDDQSSGVNSPSGTISPPILADSSTASISSPTLNIDIPPAELLTDLLSYLSPVASESPHLPLGPAQSPVARLELPPGIDLPDFTVKDHYSSRVENIGADGRLPGYVIRHSIGAGAFSKVFLGHHVGSGERVAIKRLSKNDMESTLSNQRVFREVMVHKSLRHPHICQLLEVVDSSKYLYFVLSYCRNGELYERVIHDGALPVGQARKYFRQLISAVHFCHSNQVVHRDIKLENLMLDADDNIQLIDFGLTNVFAKNILLKTKCGSQEYAAPEMITSQRYYGPSVDIWAMGVVLFGMLTGELPFFEEKANKLYSKISMANYSWPEGLSVDSSAKNLVASILTVTPSSRISISEMAAHSWVMKGYEMSPLIFERPVISDNGDVVSECARLHGISREEVQEMLDTEEPSPVYCTYSLLMNRRRHQKIQRGANYVPRLTEGFDLPYGTDQSNTESDENIIADALNTSGPKLRERSTVRKIQSRGVMKHFHGRAIQNQ